VFNGATISFESEALSRIAVFTPEETGGSAPPLETPMFCRGCSVRLNELARVCPECRTPVVYPENTISDGLLVAGWVFSFLGPIVGFIIGIVATSKKQSVAAGVGMLIVSTLMFVFWVAKFKGAI